MSVSKKTVVLPSIVRVGAILYRVEVAPLSDLRQEYASGQQSLIGYCDSVHGCIAIDKEAATNQSMADSILWHEIMHGLDSERSLNLKHRQVDQIAAGVHAFLADNAHPLKWK